MRAQFLLLWVLLAAPAASQNISRAWDLIEEPAVVLDSEDMVPIGEMNAAVTRVENSCISLMLLGSVGFMMMNFYLVNHPDPDIKFISWQVISSTISIFSAVLIFQAFDGMMEYYVLDGMPIWHQLPIDMMHMLLWFGLLQLILAYYAGAVGLHPAVQAAREKLLAFQEKSHEVNTYRRSWHHRGQTKDLQFHTDQMEKLEKHEKEKEEHRKIVHLNTKCWATLLGHTTGFAAINSWGTLQQALPHSPQYAFSVVAVAFFGLFAIFQVTNVAREKISLADDGEIDEFEEMWAEETAETENDVMALCISWLIIQAVRLFILGTLPNTEGEDKENAVIPWSAPIQLLIGGLVFSVVQLLRSAFVKDKNKSFPRVLKWSETILAMAMAWCLHFGVVWAVTCYGFKEGAWSAVMGSMITTFTALGLIFLLDMLADAEWTDAEVDDSLRTFIEAFGILIGFSWEKSFDAAVGGLAEDPRIPCSPPVAKLLMALVLAGMVIPAWKWYILSTVYQMELEREEVACPQCKGEMKQSPSDKRCSIEACTSAAARSCIKAECDYHLCEQHKEALKKAKEKKLEEADQVTSLPVSPPVSPREAHSVRVSRLNSSKSFNRQSSFLQNMPGQPQLEVPLLHDVENQHGHHVLLQDRDNHHKHSAEHREAAAEKEDEALLEVRAALAAERQQHADLREALAREQEARQAAERAYAEAEKKTLKAHASATHEESIVTEQIQKLQLEKLGAEAKLMEVTMAADAMKLDLTMSLELLQQREAESRKACEAAQEQVLASEERHQRELEALMAEAAEARHVSSTSKQHCQALSTSLEEANRKLAAATEQVLALRKALEEAEAAADAQARANLQLQANAINASKDRPTAGTPLPAEDADALQNAHQARIVELEQRSAMQAERLKELETVLESVRSREERLDQLEGEFASQLQMQAKDSEETMRALHEDNVLLQSQLSRTFKELGEKTAAIRDLEMALRDVLQEQFAAKGLGQRFPVETAIVNEDLPAREETLEESSPMEPPSATQESAAQREVAPVPSASPKATGAPPPRLQLPATSPAGPQGVPGLAKANQRRTSPALSSPKPAKATAAQPRSSRT